MRLALGPADPGGVASALARGLRGRGHDVDVVVWEAGPYGYDWDTTLTTMSEIARFAATAPGRYDAFHCFGGRSWLPYADLLHARLRRHRCVIQYNGSDCRTMDIAGPLHPARARIVDPARDRSIRLHRRIAGLVVRAAVVQDLELVTYLTGDYRAVYVAPFAINVEGLRQAEAAARPALGGPLRVLHAPSNRQVKGSDAIERAVSELADGDRAELVTVNGRPHRQVLEEVACADIVVDQLNAETPGVLSAEAMALGKPVLCEHDPAKFAAFARPSPVVAVQESTLATSLARLLDDEDLRVRLGEEGRAYAARIHHPDVAAAAAEWIYEHQRGAPVRGIFQATAEGITEIDPLTVPGLVGLPRRLRAAALG